MPSYCCPPEDGDLSLKRVGGFMCMDNLYFYFYASYVHILVHVSAYSPFFKEGFIFAFVV